MSRLKKLIAIGTTATMLLWSFGMVLPAAHAATIADGDLVKSATSSAVYYIQGATKRVFPHYNVYLSWGYPADFSTVKTVSASELAAYTDDNAIPFRDGSLFRGTATSLGGLDATAVFYVENAKIRPVLSEQVYQGLFSDTNWVRVTWVPDDLLTKFNYDMGADLTTSATHPNGCVVQYTGSSQKYLIEGGQKRAISDAAFSANRYSADSVVTIDTDEVYATGTSITGVESGLLTPGWVATTGTTTSALTASLDSSNPAGTTLPYEATNVSLLKVKMVAGSTATTVTGLTFKRNGIGLRGDWSDGLYVYEGSTLLNTSAKSLSSDTEEVEFTALNVVISANSSKIFTLKGTLNSSATSNDQHVFSLVSVETTATTTGLPLNGNQFIVGPSGSGVGTITHTLRTGEVTNPTVGQQAAKIYAFYIEADSSHNCELNQIVLTKSGTLASSGVTNIKLYQESTLIATGSAFASNDTITLTPSSPFSIEKGKKKSFTVKADLAGKRDETLSISLAEDFHLVGYDSFYGYGAKVSKVATAQSIILQGGDVTLSFNGPSAADIAQDAADVTLMKFALTTEGRSEVKRLQVELTVVSDTLVADIKDLRIKDADTGSTLMGPYDRTATGNVDKTFTDSFTMAANTTRNLIVTADIGSAAPNDMTIVAKVTVPAVSGSSPETRYIKDLDSNLYVLTSSVVPNDLTGYTMTVKTSSLTITRSSTPVSATTVTGSSNVESLGVNLAAGSASGIRISQIVAQITGATANGAWATAATTNDARDYINTVDLYDGTTLLGSANLVAGTELSTLTYNNLDINIAKNNSKKLIFKANVRSGLQAARYYYVDLDPDNITAYDDQDNDITSSGTALLQTTNPAIVMTIATTGTMTVAADSSTPDSAILIAGTTGNEVSKIKFTAENEAFVVQELRVLLRNGSTTGSSYDRSLTSVTIAYGGITETKPLSPYGADSSASFTGLTINVPKDDSMVVTINANTNTVTGGAQSGDSIELGFDSVFKAVSASGVTDNSLATSDVYGNAMVLHKTVPVITKGTVSNTTLANAEMELYKFNIAANANEDVALKQMAFDITLSEDNDSVMSVGTLALYRGTTKLSTSTDINIKVFVGATTSTAAAVAETDSKIVVSWKDNKQEVISKGTNQTYTLKGVVAGTDTGDSLMVRIAEENVASHDSLGKATYVDGNYLTLGSSYRNLIWSDYYAGVNHTAYNQGEGVGTAGSTDWINGYKVNTLPSDYTVLSR